MMSRATVIGIGEILWDVFPDGPRFGGAPANFACSVAELARDRIDVYMAGGAGADDLGRKAIGALHAHGVDTSCVAVVDRPTGLVLVELDAAGGASYEFTADTAWDNVAWSDELQKLAARADAVCFSTLGQRSEISRQTIQRFVRATPAGCLRVLDINLRPPFWNEAIVLQSLQLANVLKLNDAELSVLADMLGWSGADHELLQQLVDRFSPAGGSSHSRGGWRVTAERVGGTQRSAGATHHRGGHRRRRRFIHGGSGNRAAERPSARDDQRLGKPRRGVRILSTRSDALYSGLSASALVVLALT